MGFPRSASSWLLAVLLVASGLAIGRWGPRWLPLGAEAVRRPDVVLQVRELARLEGVTVQVERVVDLKVEQRALFGLVPADDTILLVASGEVVAGVDLGKLRAEDVSVAEHGRSVTIRLPRAEVFSARLDNARTYVHSRKTDILAQRNDALETRARQTAEQTLRAAAEDSGIVERAEESVGRTVRSLVRSLGFAEVHIAFGGAA